MTRHVGGSFAPPLTDELLAKYRSDVAALDAGPIRDACATLLAACVAWWHLPESQGVGEQHPSGSGRIVPLDDSAKAALCDLVPWEHDIAGIQCLLVSLPAGATRNMAFHLLWHVVELGLDREPITSDKL